MSACWSNNTLTLNCWLSLCTEYWHISLRLKSKVLKLWQFVKSSTPSAKTMWVVITLQCWRSTQSISCRTTRYKSIKRSSYRRQGSLSYLRKSFNQWLTPNWKKRINCWKSQTVKAVYWINPEQNTWQVPILNQAKIQEKLQELSNTCHPTTD